MIRPYVSPRPRPRMGWLLDERTYLEEGGGRRLLEQAGDVQVWAGFELVNELLRACHGEAVCWDGKPIRWSPVQDAASYTVRVLHYSYPESPEEALHGLAGWRDWLGRYGAAPGGSLGGSGLSLVKATLREPLWTAVGDVPPVRFVLGGRQEWGPLTGGGHVVVEGPLAHQDMKAAYARTLGELHYGGQWLEAGGMGSLLRRGLELNGRLLFVRAKVRVPDMALGPLPVRPRAERSTFLSLAEPIEYPTGREIQGTWTWEELEEAEASGCRIVKVLGAWAHTSIDRPFEPWWEAVQDGRSRPGFAGGLAKATGNATWGMFAIRSRGRRQVLRRVPGPHGSIREWSKPLPEGGNPTLRAPDLAESITGRVRAELHRGMRLQGDALVSAHTDGLWAFEGRTVPGWRVKLRARSMRYVNPQCFAYVDREGREEFVVAGVPAWKAAEHFERTWAEEEERRAGRPHALGGPVAADPIPVVRRGRARHLRVVA